MSAYLWAIIACGVVSILYAVVTVQSVMKADAGNARMQEIATAIREGASAYLNRQYATIGALGNVSALTGSIAAGVAGPIFDAGRIVWR